MSTRVGVAIAVTALLTLVSPALGTGEVGPVLALPKADVATCLRTPAPGIASLLGPLGRRTSPIDLLRVESPQAGFAPRQRLTFGPLLDCPAVASNGRGTSIVAGYVYGRTHVSLRAGVIEAGTTRAFDLAAISPTRVSKLAATVSPRGDAIVAWTEESRVRHGRKLGRVLVERRPPGGAFKPPEVLSPWRTMGEYGSVALAAGADAAGRFTLAWARGVPDRGRFSDLSVVEATTAFPGAPFAATQTIASRAEHASTTALAVAPDGRALLAFDGTDAVRVAERPPGGDRFAAPSAYFEKDVPYGEPAVALRDDGAAVVAWRTDNYDQRGGVKAISRTPAGAFSPPTTITRPERSSTFEEIITFGTAGRPLPPRDPENRRLQVMLTPDDRVVLSWVEPRRLPDRDLVLRPRIALGSLAAPGRYTVMALGSPCRAANGATPIAGTDGRAGVAWTDNLTSGYFGAGTSETAQGGGRLHIAGLEPKDPPAGRPHVTIRVRPQRLHFGEPLRVSVACKGPCDVRGLLAGRSQVQRYEGKRFVFPPTGPGGLGTAALGRAGRVVLHIRPPILKHVAPRKRSRVRAAIHICDPASGAMVIRHLRVRVSRRPVPALAVPIGVSAERAGHQIVVRWRTARAARRTTFIVHGRRFQHAEKLDPEPYGFDYLRGLGHRSFVIRLRPRFADRVHFVSVQALADDPPRRSHTVVVPVGP